MGKIVVGCWDCDYCGADRISGEIKICPNCGKPRGKDITFYMAGESEANYFESKEKDRELEKKREEARREAEGANVSKASPGRSRLPLFIALFIAAGLLIYLLMPKTKGLHVDGKSWERAVSVERYQEVQDSSWDLPDGAWNVTSREEIYTYNHVFDHYETRTREVSEQVLDGYDTEIEYRDLGNGYYEEIEHQVPRYRTEYHTETYEEPVYVDVPVFAKKYYYSIMKWERESGRSEKYWIQSGDKQYRIKYDLWQQVKTGSDIKATVNGGEIIELK